MQRLSVRLPDDVILKLESMLAAQPPPAFGPPPTLSDVLRVVVERGLEAMSGPTTEPATEKAS